MQTLESPATATSQLIVRADRIARIGDKWLGRLSLDESTLRQLSQSQIGLLAEGFISLDTMLGRILPLASRPVGFQSIVLYASKEAGHSIYQHFVDAGRCAPSKALPVQWRVGALTFSSIEALKQLESAREPIDLVVMLDPTCMVYRARTMKTASGRTHDRPQIIVDYISDHVFEGMHPAFLLMTTKRAAALPTDLIARTYCRDAFWFLDGPSLTC